MTKYLPTHCAKKHSGIDVALTEVQKELKRSNNVSKVGTDFKKEKGFTKLMSDL